VAAEAPDYDPPAPNPWDQNQDFGHSHWHNSLIWGEGLANFSIVGPGLIWGKGDPGACIPRTGRIKFGTESNGGFQNITVSNCVFEGCGGLALETVDGALL
jgi:polygalacturonase